MDKTYVVPSDGYVYLRANSEGSYAHCIIYGAIGGNAISESVQFQNKIDSKSVFVKKGMRIFMEQVLGSVTCGFLRLY